MRTVSVVQGTSDWHRFRSFGIGGSEAPILAGVSPYRNPSDVFLEKRIPGFRSKDQIGKNWLFNRGHRIETNARAQFQALTGAEMNPICVMHREFDHIIASLDGLDSELGVLETKLVGKEVLKRAIELNEIPLHHEIQMQHGMEAADADVGHWFGSDGKGAGAFVTVRRHRAGMQALLAVEHRFWEGVLAGKLPAEFRPTRTKAARSRMTARATVNGARLHIEGITGSVSIASDSAMAQRIERRFASRLEDDDSSGTITIVSSLGGR